MIVFVLAKLICFLWYIGRFKITEHMAEKKQRHNFLKGKNVLFLKNSHINKEIDILPYMIVENDIY